MIAIVRIGLLFARSAAPVQPHSSMPNGGLNSILLPLYPESSRLGAPKHHEFEVRAPAA
jgi:hypothetical protein